MKSSKLTLISLAVLALGGGLVLSGCGGSSKTPAQVQAPTSAGVVVNSYLYGATVTLDFNDNGVCEPTEPKVISSLTGAYSFPGLGNHMVCSTGGFNTATRLPFIGELKAPAGGGVITPLTTLVVAQIGTITAGILPTPAQVSAAQNRIETQLSLPPNSISLDPVAAIASNPKIEQTNAAVQVMLQSIASSVIALAGVPTAAATQSALQNQVFANAVMAMVSTLASVGAPVVNLTAASVDTANDTFVLASVQRTLVNVTTTAPLLVAAAPANAVMALSPVNAAAFVAGNISTLVQSVAQVVNPTALSIAAASTDAQQSTAIVNAVEALVINVPTLFTIANTAAPATMIALAEIVAPNASVVANTAVAVDLAILVTALNTAGVVVSSAVVASLEIAVESLLAEPVQVVLATVVLTVVPPLPPPMILPAATGAGS